MNESMRSRLGAFIAALLGLAFVWTLVLSVSPQLHARIHADANRVDHNCAVTFVASATCHHSAHPPLITAPRPPISLARVAALTPQCVESPFLLASIFEHAPPANS